MLRRQLTTIFFIFLLIGIMSFTGCAKAAPDLADELRLGYCPTMKSFAVSLQEKNDGLVLVETVSAARAFDLLAKQELDMVIVGRLATIAEQGVAHQRILGEGYTLITKEKSFIDEVQLSSIIVHTAVTESVVEQLLPYSIVYYYDTTAQAIMAGLHDAVLINWDEFSDDYQLLVVLDEEIKAKEFRLSVLYGSKMIFALQI